MIQEIKKIEYKRGMLNKGIGIAGLPVKTIKASKLSSEIHKLINETNLLNLGGSYGIKGLGDPDEYDNLKIFLTHKVVEIEFYNRGVIILTTNNDIVKKIHYIICKIDNL